MEKEMEMEMYTGMEMEMKLRWRWARRRITRGRILHICLGSYSCRVLPTYEYAEQRVDEPTDEPAAAATATALA